FGALRPRQHAEVAFVSVFHRRPDPVDVDAGDGDRCLTHGRESYRWSLTPPTPVLPFRSRSSPIEIALSHRRESAFPNRTSFPAKIRTFEYVLGYCIHGRHHGDSRPCDHVHR